MMNPFEWTPKSGAEATAVQTLARLSVAIAPREASGVRRVYRRFGSGW